MNGSDEGTSAVCIRFAVIFLKCGIKLKKKKHLGVFSKDNLLFSKQRIRRSSAIVQTHDLLLAPIFPGVTGNWEFRMLLGLLHKMLHI